MTAAAGALTINVTKAWDTGHIGDEDGEGTNAARKTICILNMAYSDPCWSGIAFNKGYEAVLHS